MKTDPALETPARTKGPLQAWLHHVPPSPHPEGRHLEELSAQRKGLIVSVPWTVAPGPKATQDEWYLLWALARRDKFNGGTVGKEGTVRDGQGSGRRPQLTPHVCPVLCDLEQVSSPLPWPPREQVGSWRPHLHQPVHSVCGARGGAPQMAAQSGQTAWVWDVGEAPGCHPAPH